MIRILIIIIVALIIPVGLMITALSIRDNKKTASNIMLVVATAYILFLLIYVYFIA